MRRRRIYVIMTALLALFYGIYHLQHTKRLEVVVAGQESLVSASGWGQTIASEINKKTIYLQVNGKKYASTQYGMYMNEEMELMLDVRHLPEIFGCAANLYEGNRLVLEYNGEKIHVTEGLVTAGKSVYMPLFVMEDGFAYSYTWSMAEGTAIVQSMEDTKERLPVSYDYRKEDRAPRIHDQGRFGTCWAFATLTALESTMLPEETEDFSEDHMSINSGFASTQNEGGDYNMAMAYLVGWNGPILEMADPYGDGISPVGVPAMKHVQEVQILGSKDYTAIKRAVYLYGGVQTSLYMSLPYKDASSKYYNKENSSYCYIGTEKANHDIVVIGWDDTYPKENFNLELESDGAFICANSWGEDFGEDGIFYVSYYDTNIGIHSLSYTKIEDVDNYDSIYQSDLCGWVGQMGYGRDTAYFANVYRANTDEILKAVGFYATGPDTKYEIYVVKDAKDKYSFYEREKVTEGLLSLAGYYTIELEKEIPLEGGQPFAVMVKITTPGAVHPIAVEYVAGDRTSTVTIEDGEGYISSGGTHWNSVEDTQDSNLCLKAYTINKR